MKEKRKIIVYGLGKVYNRLINLLQTEYEIVGVCDKNSEKSVEKYKFYSIDEVSSVACDYIFITSQKYFKEIKEELVHKYKIQP